MNVPARTPQPEGEQEPANVVFRRQLEQRLDSFADALPEHITVQRFKSVVMQAVMSAPELLAADRVSLFEACLAAANDGLVPDKKEGALVVYNTKLPKVDKRDPDVWIKKVQWLPMVRGVITKIYNTGKVKSVSLDIVYGGDHFRYWKDDAGEHLEHEPAMDRDKSIIQRVYAMVIMKAEHGSGVFAEVLDMNDVEKVKTASKTSSYGPWVDWFEEMAKKTALKRLAKRLPIAREIEGILSRDNFMYDMDQPRAALADQRPARKSLASKLDELAEGVPMANVVRETVNIDRDTGEIIDNHPADQAEKSSERGPSPAASGGSGKQASAASATATGSQPSSGAPSPDEGDPIEAATRKGRAACRSGKSRRANPYKDGPESAAWYAGFDDEAAADGPEPGSEG